MGGFQNFKDRFWEINDALTPAANKGYFERRKRQKERQAAQAKAKQEQDAKIAASKQEEVEKAKVPPGGVRVDGVTYNSMEDFNKTGKKDFKTFYSPGGGANKKKTGPMRYRNGAK